MAEENLDMNVSYGELLNEGNASGPTGNTSEPLVSIVTSFHLYMTRFIVQRILVPIVVSGGVVGNMFNIIVLRNPKMRSSTNVYLMALAVCDSMYLVFSLTLSFVHCSNKGQNASAFYYIPFGRVISDLFGNTAVLLTVSFTLERYIGVCHPMKGKAWCTVRKAKVASMLAFVVCIVNTLPEMFELEITQEFVESDSEFLYECRYTEFAETESYQIGYYWWYVTLFTFAPLLFLSIFNSLLIRSVWRANRNRKLLSNTRVVGESQRQSLEQQKVTTMLIAVVIIFLLCQLPQAVVLVYRSYLKSNNIPHTADMFRIAGNVCNLLVQINASVNFLLYSYFSSRFRRTFKKLFCRWKFPRRRRNTNILQSSLTRKSSSTTGTTLSSNISCRSHNIVTSVSTK